jgi:hypothetical protein
MQRIIFARLAPFCGYSELGCERLPFAVLLDQHRVKARQKDRPSALARPVEFYGCDPVAIPSPLPFPSPGSQAEKGLGRLAFGTRMDLPAHGAAFAFEFLGNIFPVFQIKAPFDLAGEGRSGQEFQLEGAIRQRDHPENFHLSVVLRRGLESDPACHRVPERSVTIHHHGGNLPGPCFNWCPLKGKSGASPIQFWQGQHFGKNIWGHVLPKVNLPG